MKTLLMMLAMAALAAAPAYAQGGTGEEPGKAEPKKEAEPEKEKPDGEKKADEAKLDTLKPFRTKGNFWMHKLTSKSGDSTVTTYSKYEVLELTENEASVKVTTFNGQKEETGSYEYKQSLKLPEGGDVGDADMKKSEEKVRVEAGEFNCIKVENKTDFATTTTWTDKASGLLVKLTSKSEGHESTTELTEHKIA